MRLRVAIPAKEAKVLHDKLKALFDDVEVEDWEQGDLEIVICFCNWSL